MKTPIKIIALSTVAAALFSGCVTTTLETSATMTQSVFLDPVAASKRIVFLNIKNTSGKNINIEPKLRNILNARGYVITDDPEQATYILSTNILYCDKKQENNAAAAMGAAGGIGLGIAAYNHTGASAIAGGGLLAAAAGGIIGKLTEDVIYQMQVDINIKERKKGGVVATKGSSRAQAQVNQERRAGFLNELAGMVRGTKSAHLQSNITNTDSQSYKSDYIEHNTMMFAEATKMHLKLEEAIPALEDKIANQIAGLF